MKANCPRLLRFFLFLVVLSCGMPLTAQAPASPFYDFRAESPGTIHKVTVGDLPAPGSQRVGVASPEPLPRPANAFPKTLPGFKVNLYASDLTNPRELRAAPNGDVFLAEMDKGDIKVFRGVTKDGRPEQTATFASNLREPFGIAFYPPGANPEWIYIGDTDSVMRFPYHNGDLKARGEAQTVVDEILSGRAPVPRRALHPRPGIFPRWQENSTYQSARFRTLTTPTIILREFHRANILECNPDGSGLRVFASGIRNPVGLAIEPKTGELWTAVNERDNLGDNLVPDYTTHVQDGGFYGWPWYYIGKNHDPRLERQPS